MKREQKIAQEEMRSIGVRARRQGQRLVGPSAPI